MQNCNIPPKMVVPNIAVCIFIVVLIDGTQSYFECYGDLCNVHKTQQYCSNIYERCFNCDDVVNDCFTTEMPLNCTITCKDHVLAQQRGSSCPLTETLEHGNHNESKLSYPGDVVSFSCDPGYLLEGAKVLTCMDFGHWSQLSPKCIAITCLRPTTVLNGRWSNGEENSTFPNQHTIDLYCKNGFDLEGSRTWECTEKGWVSSSNVNDHVPVCKARRDLSELISATIACAALAFVEGFVIIILIWKLCSLRKRLQRLDWKNEKEPLIQVTETTTKESDPVSLRRERDRKGYNPNLPSPNTIGKEDGNVKTKVDGDTRNNAYRVESERENPVTRTHSGDCMAVEENRFNQNRTTTEVNLNLTLMNNNDHRSLNVNYYRNATEHCTFGDHAEPRNNGIGRDDGLAPKETVPQRPDDVSKHPVMESQNQDETDPKTAPLENAAKAGTPAGVVQPSGSNEQDLNPKVVVGDRFFHHGDNNGTTTSPNGYLQNKITVPSGN